MTGPGDAGEQGGLVDWFVRRAGVARFATLACALGLALAALAGAWPVLALAGLVASLVAAIVGGACSVKRMLVPAVVLVGLFAGYLGGTVRLQGLEASELRPFVGRTVQARLAITGAVRSSSGWLSAVADMRMLDGRVVRETVLLEIPPPVDRGKCLALVQGMIVELTGTLRLPEGPTGTGFDQAKELRRQGISVVLRARSCAQVTVLGRRGGVAGLFDRLRSAAIVHLGRGPDPRVNEVLQGVVMGDTTGIDEGWLTAFRRSGTAHMLSVSGLHVASLAAIMMGLMRLLRAPRWAGYLAAAGAALLLIPLVGESPPVVRSAVMIIVVLLGRWVGRSRDQWQVLGLAAAVVLALNPFAVFDVGFQLSFSAFVGMLLLLRPLRRMLRRLPAGVASNVAVSLAASAGTAPVALLVFGKTSLVSPLANLLVVPTLPLITGLGMASIFLGFLWSGLSVALDTLASLPMTWTILVSRLMAWAPVLDAASLGKAVVALAVAAAVLPLALALLGRCPRVPFGLPLPYFKRATAWMRGHRPRNRRWKTALSAALVAGGLLLGLAAYAAAARTVDAVATVAHRTAWPVGVEVRALDVGQGNAVLVRTPAHHALLFDGGPAGCDLAAKLRSLGVSTLDLVVISHPHADHFAGLLEALGKVKVKSLIDEVEVVARGAETEAGANSAAKSATSRGARVAGASSSGQGERASPSEAADYVELRRELEAEGCHYASARPGTCLGLDGMSLCFFVPARPLVLVDGPDPWAERGEQPSGDDLNASSLVCVLGIGPVHALLPGDAEADTLESYDIPSADIMVVPHHGSRGGVTPELLKKWGTRVAMVSVGAHNPFGHPYPGTMSVLERAARAVLRTDSEGWVSCTVSGGQITIATERTPPR